MDLKAMLKLSTKADLERLIVDEVQESLTLDYKASPALSNESKARDELCKDVSAFANSAGGQIVYGIEERDRKPIRVDEGSDLTREWIEQVIDSKVQPRLESVLVTPIEIKAGRHAYVLTIAQSTTRAPHQAPDKKYYKRQNFQSAPMEDYEIRDVLRRASTPDLYVELSFELGNTARVEFKDGNAFSEPIVITATVTNRSSQPAFHALLQIGIDIDLQRRATQNFYSIGERDGLFWLGNRFQSPPALPIFKEMDPLVGHGLRSDFSIALPSRLVMGDALIYLATSIQTPGYSANERWVILGRGHRLELCPPGHPYNR